MKSKIIGILCFLLCVLNLSSQTLINPDDLPEVEDYIFIQTNASADTVILAFHGGPTSSLFAGSFEYLETIPTFSVVEVAKLEMIRPILEDLDLTIEEGIAVNDTTVALIEKVVQHYKDQDKMVVLIGHSWGSIILGEYLDDYGTESIDKIIPMEGRLNAQLEFVDSLENGWLPTFSPVDQTLEYPTDQYFYPQSLLNLAVAAFENRWIDSLANMDMSKMMYTYAENDVQTGALVQEEIDFVNNSGAELLFIPNAGHGASFDIPNQEIIVAFIRQGEMSGVDDYVQKIDALKIYPSIAQQFINVQSKGKGDISIYDLMGRIVYQKNDVTTNDQLDISHLSNGNYVALMRDASGKISRGRFIVQH